MSSYCLHCLLRVISLILGSVGIPSRPSRATICDWENSCAEKFRVGSIEQILYILLDRQHSGNAAMVPLSF